MDNAKPMPEIRAHITKELKENGLDNDYKVYSLVTGMSYETYEYLIHTQRLAPELLLSMSISMTNNSNISADEFCHYQHKVMELAVTNYGDLNSLWSLSSSLPSINSLEYLLKMGLRPSNAIKLLVNTLTTDKESKYDLIKLLIAKGGNFSALSSLYHCDLQDVEFFIENGMDATKAAELILNSLRKGYQPNTVEALTDKQKHLLDVAVKTGADLNSLDIFETISITTVDNTTLPYVIPPQILKTLIDEYSLNPKVALKYAIKNNIMEFDILAHNIDYNEKESDNTSLLDLAVTQGRMELVDLMLAHGATATISLDSYFTGVHSKFNIAAKVVEKFSQPYDDETLVYDLIRAHGVSEIATKDFLDYRNLINDYLATLNGANILSELEMNLLSGAGENETALTYQDVVFNNKYGYQPLHLAMLAGKFELADSMINHGFDLYAKTHNNATIFHLNKAAEDSYEDSQASTKLLHTIAKRLNDVDIDLGNGNKVVDILISNSEFTDKAIALTNDELFYFFKEDADLFKPSKNPDKTYVAISHGDGFWSTGAWSLARNLVKTHPDTTFYLVKDEMLAKGGDEFLKQFDAIINPGAGDSFPSDMPEFTKQDVSMMTNLELHYQNMLDKSYQLDIPYLGMCAGAQHFSMYHGGSIKPVQNYAGEKKHQITFIKGTLAHFMSLTKDQQLDLLENCILPDVTVNGETAHHYAAVNDKLGLDLELGAVSEENVAMAFAHTNGIRYATQFHPEHHYTLENATYEKSWLDNFINIASMHHEYRMGQHDNPIDYFSNIQQRLAECVKPSTYLIDELQIAGQDSCANEMYY